MSIENLEKEINQIFEEYKTNTLALTESKDDRDPVSVADLKEFSNQVIYLTGGLSDTIVKYLREL